jgi:hypothetical protein
MGRKEPGHLITWTEEGKDFWEYTDDLEMLVHLYDQALSKCGEESIYLFPVSDVFTLQETRRTIESARHNLKELNA